MKGLKINLSNMKKYNLIIIIGGLFLIMGLILSFNKKNEEINYYYGEVELTKEEAESLIIEKVGDVMSIYEKPKEVFEVVNETPNNNENENTNEESNEYLKVNNYDAIIDELYTEDGKKELESMSFNDKLFVKKEDDKVYVLANIPSDNLYLGKSMTISDVIVKLHEINATISFVSDQLGSDDALNYYIYEKKISLIKKDDKWLINAFKYSNV